MKIAIVTAWYNEEDLAPYFLRHYDYVDEIHVILDTATNDRTREIIGQDPRVIIHEMTYPEDGLDWTMKQDKVDEVYAHIKADWVFAVDGDEFLYKRGEPDMKAFLARQTGDIMWARLYQVYRHETDSDLDPTKPPLMQRRHGDPTEPTSTYYLPDKAYLKPIVIRGGLKPEWDCGCHNYSAKHLIECKDSMDGAHWHMADPQLAIKRRLQTKARQGAKNIKNGLGVQNHNITEDEIRLECFIKQNCPIVIYTDYPAQTIPKQKTYKLSSIIIPCWNKLEFTQQCIESIEAFTPEPHEIIFVDNGSTDGTTDWIKSKMMERPYYRLIQNTENRGYPVACNQGIAIAKGDYIVLLNNDVVVSNEWLKGLIDCIESSNDIAIVGPSTNYASGPQMVTDCGGYDTILKFTAFAENYRKALKGCYIPYWRIVGFCMMVRREVLDKIGGFDERFSPGNFEDDDICIRACLAGYRNMICKDVFVHHHGSISHDGGFTKLLETNQTKFNEKYAGIGKTISACIIVKNEQGNIKGCLNTIYDDVDEIIVVDTGSTDATKEIARSVGDKVKIYDFQWTDDFSDARNFANSKATMDWILSVDADEAMVGIKNITLMPYTAYRIETRNYTSNPQYTNIRFNKGDHPDYEVGIGWFPSTKIRLFPRDKRICWEYPVHEVVENSVYYLGMRIIECRDVFPDVIVHHYGRINAQEYDNEHAQKYYDLLHKQFKTGKNDLRSLEQLAIQAQGLKKYDEAINFWFNVLEIDPQGTLAPLNLTHCYAEKGDWISAKQWASKAIALMPDSRDARVNYALCEFHTGDHNTAEKIARELLANNPLDPIAAGLSNAINKLRHGGSYHGRKENNVSRL